MNSFLSKAVSFSTWPVFAKTVFSSVVIILMVLLSFAFYFMPRIEANVIENKQLGLRNALECVVTQVEHLNEQVETGAMSLEEAQDKAVEIVTITRFNGMRDYMYANDLEGYCRASVVEENIGTYVANSTDYYGQDTHQTYVDLALSPDQGGYTFFSWEIADDNFRDSILVTRMYCMEFFEPWGWYFVNGMSMVDPRIDDDIQSEITALRNAFFMVLFFIAIIALVITYFVADYIRKRIVKLTNITEELARGNLNVKMHLDGGNTPGGQGVRANAEGKNPDNPGKSGETDEIGHMSLALKVLIDGLKEKASFAQKIGEGELQTSFERLSEEDALGAALLEMRQSLQKARDDEQQRKTEDEKRNWVTLGLARFADILRTHTHSMEELCFETLKNLIQYTDMNQGGVFLFNEEAGEKGMLELVACYAFERRKYMEKQILPGEGMVGAVFLEKKSQYMKRIPQDYLHITSGLGGANPDVLLIVPLIFNEKIYGVMELASFKPLEDYQVQFIEKVAENIASTVSTVKISSQTAILLEQSQQQAEEMRAQEEEMRQNMEEMQATQEEMMRKERSLVESQNAMDALCTIARYDLSGRTLSCNTNFAELLQYPPHDITGRYLGDFFTGEDFNEEQKVQLLARLKSGQSIPVTFRRKAKDEQIVTQKGILYPVADEAGSITEIMEMTIDVTPLSL